MKMAESVTDIHRIAAFRRRGLVEGHMVVQSIGVGYTK